jgi:RNA polymerase sigma-70 factor (ECF subfamily)
MVSGNRSTSLSLLERLKNPADDEAWRRFHDCYGPLLRRWMQGRGVNANDADDLQQEIMQVAMAELPTFEHNGRPGALRNWLKQVTANRMRTFWRRQNRQAAARGGSDYAAIAEQLADPSSELSALWDEEYRHTVCTRLLEVVSEEFQRHTIEAFRRVAIEGQTAADVAQALQLTPNAVRIAQSRVMRRMRELGAGMID